MKSLLDFLKKHYKNYLIYLIFFYAIFSFLNLLINYYLLKKNIKTMSVFVDVYFQNFENELESKVKQTIKIFENLEVAFKKGEINNTKNIDIFLKKNSDLNLNSSIISENGVIIDTNNPAELGLNLMQYSDAMQTLTYAKKTKKLFVDYPVVSSDYKSTFIYLLKYFPEKKVFLQLGYPIDLYYKLLDAVSENLINYDLHYDFSIYHIYFGEKPEVLFKIYGEDHPIPDDFFVNKTNLTEKSLTKSSLLDYRLFKLIKNKTKFGFLYIFHVKPLYSWHLFFLIAVNGFFLVGTIVSYIFFPAKINKFIVKPLKMLSQKIKAGLPFDYKGDLEEIAIIVNSYKQHLETIKVRDFLKKVINAREAEREKIANDVHDTVLQELSYILIKLKQQENDELSIILKNQIQKLRKLIIDEDIIFVKKFGFINYLEIFIKRLAEKNIEINFIFENSFINNVNLSNQKSIHLMRAIKEIIHNSIKHSKCKNVYIKLKNDENFMYLVVSDDGEGFDIDNVENAENHIGLILIKERLFIINATYDLVSDRTGTIYNIKIPII